MRAMDELDLWNDRASAAASPERQENEGEPAAPPSKSLHSRAWPSERGAQAQAHSNEQETARRSSRRLEAALPHGREGRTA